MPGRRAHIVKWKGVGVSRPARFTVSARKPPHPGEFLDFSREDLTTMEAVEAGTGKTFTWSIVTRTGFLSRKGGKDQQREDAPWWLNLLRRLSYGEPRRHTTIRKRKEPIT